MRLLMIDNYDSFTYNLVHLFEELGAEVVTVRNDAITVAEARAGGFDRLVVSPGPGRPESAGVSIELIRALGPTVPTLGVCLGHQAIVEAFGGTGSRARSSTTARASTRACRPTSRSAATTPSPRRRYRRSSPSPHTRPTAR